MEFSTTAVVLEEVEFIGESTFIFVKGLTGSYNIASTDLTALVIEGASSFILIG